MRMIFVRDHIHLAAIDTVLAEHGDQLAAILVEPIAANMGLVPPSPTFLAGLRERCTRTGALLVFDEVITGFRVGRAGRKVRYRLTPDLSIFGKVVGGGLPLAAVGGAAAVMDELAPLGPVYQAGTLSGNPLATAAGLAALALLDDDSYAGSKQRPSSSRPACAKRSPRPVSPRRSPTRTHSSVCSSRRIRSRDYAGAQAADHAGYAQLFHGLLDRGVYFAPSGYETLFPSLAHTDADIEQTIEAAADAAASMR